MCLVTAAVLILYYNPVPTRSYRLVVSWTHRIAGVSLIVFPVLALAGNRGDYRLHLHNIKQAWSWTLADLRWLVLACLSVVNRRVSLPDQGRFNAGEKLNFMMVMTTYPLLILTGVMIWLPGVAFLSWVVHVGVAVAVAPVVVGHMYMALVNPRTRKGLPGMITGYVDRNWAKQHYQLWYADNFADGRADTGSRGHGQPLSDAPSPARVEPFCPSCRERVSAPWAWLVRRIFEEDAMDCPNCCAEMKEFSVSTDSTTLRSMLTDLEQAHLEAPSMESAAAYSLVDPAAPGE